MKEFHMILPSNSCPTTQPENSANKFIVDWENSIQLEGSWIVGLTEFIYFHYPITLKKGARMYGHVKTLKTEKYELIWNKLTGFFYTTKSDHDFIYKIEFNVTENVHKATKGAKLRIKTTGELMDMKFSNNNFGLENGKYNEISGPYCNVYNDQYLTTTLTVTHEVDEGKYELAEADEDINASSTEDLAQKIFTKFPFFKCFEATDAKIKFKVLPKFIRLVMDTDLSKILGFTQKQFLPDNDYISTNKVQLTKGIENMYIYCSILEPILVGGVKVPLLKSVWIDERNKMGDIVAIKIDNPMYIPVTSSSINNIEINIRNDLGELVPFSYGSKTSLTLHFKKL